MTQNPMFRTVFTLTSILCIVTTIAGSDSEVRKIKYEPSQPLFLVMKMKPAGGHLVIKNGAPSGEIDVEIPADSGASLVQDGNKITINGQSKPSTYYFRVPAGKIDIERPSMAKRRW